MSKTTVLATANFNNKKKYSNWKTNIIIEETIVKSERTKIGTKKENYDMIYFKNNKDQKSE